MSQPILVFAGKKVGLECLTFLLAENAPIVQIVAATDEDSAILGLANAHKIPIHVFSTDVVNELCESTQRFGWLLNLWSPHILPVSLLQIAEHRLNVHPGLMPHGKGNDCVAWALRDKASAGASLLEMDEGIDTGAIYARQEVIYEFPMRGSTLHESVVETCICLFRNCWPAIYRGELRPVPQIGDAIARRRRDTNTDRIRNADETGTLEEFVGWLLAHDFAPSTTAELLRDGRRYAITLNVEPLDDD